MTQERQIEIKKEATRRLNIWLENSSFDKMSVGGSLLRFDMSLSLIGTPAIKEKWMINFNKFVTTKEFNSNEYDEIIQQLYNEQLKNK
jgi:hypothetical protein